MEKQRDVTIYDIAREVDVSPATVSRALKDNPAIKKDTRKRVKEAAIKLGYQHNRFASNLRIRKTNTIGIIIPRLNSYFMSTVIAGVEKIVNQRGYNLIIIQSQENVAKEIAGVNTMFNSRVDGLLVSLAADTETVEHFDALLQKKIPVVFFDRVAEHPACTSIVIDNVRAGYDVTKHLVEQGCKRIVYIGGNLRRNVYADRLKGFRLALKESGFATDESQVIITDLSEASSIDAAKRILEMSPRVDGIFAANDTAAVACIQEFKHAGLSIPGDIAIAGFNNDPVSRVIEPNLTTINYPGNEMGEIAAATLINNILQMPSTTIDTLVIRHQLIVRASSLRNPA